MKELEVQTYNFAVEVIGFVKSLEKKIRELVKTELKHSYGAVSLKYMDALDANENEDFASNLKDCLEKSKKSSELLSNLKGVSNENLLSQQITLIGD